MTATVEPEAILDPVDYLDNVLRLIGHVRGLKTRDPLRTLEDVILDLRAKVRE
jgi:hypothetical protein